LKLEPQRIGLIEVGSNTIRYLVADWTDMAFDRVKIETIKHGIHPSRPSEDAVAEVNRSVEGFLADAATRDCDALFAYGTAACRTVAERFPGVLSRRIKVLTPAEEAMASWVAGFACTSRAPGTECTVIDQGSGSTEVVRATWNGSGFDDLAFHSVDIGSVSLLEGYKRDVSGHFARSHSLIAGMVPALDEAGLAPAEAGDLFLVGGAATSIGWQAAFGTGLQNYVPAELNGKSATLDDLQQLYTSLQKELRRDPVAARRRVDTRPGSEDHILRILSTFPYLVVLASYLKPGDQRPFFFSGYGARHGMAFLIQHDLIKSDAK
jgi:exopolyphosphatase/pppGpp-phosphohydrolase